MGPGWVRWWVQRVACGLVMSVPLRLMLPGVQADVWRGTQEACRSWAGVEAQQQRERKGEHPVVNSKVSVHRW